MDQNIARVVVAMVAWAACGFVTASTAAAQEREVTSVGTATISAQPELLRVTVQLAGTRVPVESLFDYLKRGRTINYFLEQFPTVKREQVEQLLDDAKAHALPERTVA